MGELVRTLSETDKPLCPNTGPVANEAHQTYTRTLNAFYDAADKNDDSEMPEAVEKAYQGAAYGRMTDRMDLFRYGVGFAQGSQYVRVESWWWQCRICGFVLPAQRTPENTR
ncbi:hypothetical protein [Verrucosispora sp. TAA-831]|uniref:hypothetical protein n=1 Tax=Verrucosispora sp. TAA-831 TaxID=3422227 RepID=UPI003D6E2B36